MYAIPLIPGLSVPLASNSNREFEAWSVYYEALNAAAETGTAAELSITHFAAEPAVA